MLRTSHSLAGKLQWGSLVLAAVVATVLSGNTHGQPSATGAPLTIDEANVKRLQQLLKSYYTDMDKATQTGPSAEEIARRQMAERDAQRQAKIPYSIEKVRLDGTEGSTAMAHMSKRLLNPGIPESRRDTAPICIIKTRLFDTLIGSESRSLKPVGKNHYVATVNLQAGDSSLSIKSQSWEVQLPEHAEAREFIITFYRPPGGSPELHVFAIEDLLAIEDPHIPSWLPPEIQAKLRQE